MNLIGSDIKFTQKGFLDKLYTDTEFSTLFMSQCNTYMEELLRPKDTDEDVAKRNNVNQLLQSMINTNTKMMDI